MSSRVWAGGDQRVASSAVECEVHLALRYLDASLGKVAGRSKVGVSVGAACVAGLFLMASGATAVAQMQSIPQEQAAAPASTNGVVSRRGQPPDGDVSQLSGAVDSFAQLMAPYMDQAQDAEVEVWLDAEGAISFAAVYKPGKAAEAAAGELSTQDKERVSGLLKELGAEASAVRKRATEELKKFGSAVIPLLQAHKGRESDPEVVDRCKQVLAAVDGRLVVRDYDGMIGAIKGVRSNSLGKRYVVSIPAEWFGRWMNRRGYRERPVRIDLDI